MGGLSALASGGGGGGYGSSGDSSVSTPVTTTVGTGAQNFNLGPLARPSIPTWALLAGGAVVLFIGWRLLKKK